MANIKKLSEAENGLILALQTIKELKDDKYTTELAAILLRLDKIEHTLEAVRRAII